MCIRDRPRKHTCIGLYDEVNNILQNAKHRRLGSLKSRMNRQVAFQNSSPFDPASSMIYRQFEYRLVSEQKIRSDTHIADSPQQFNIITAQVSQRRSPQQVDSGLAKTSRIVIMRPRREEEDSLADKSSSAGIMENEGESQAKKLLEDDVKQNFKKYFAILFIIGLINNSGYVLVGNSAQNIAASFDMQNFMALFQFCLIINGGLVRIINSKFLLNIRHKIRVMILLTLSVSANLILSLSNSTSHVWGFYAALAASVMMGTSSSLGESTMLGFLKGFPSELVVGWGSGTGFAGVYGSGFYLIMQSLEVENKYVFLMMIPLAAVYWICMNWLNNKKKTVEAVAHQTKMENEEDPDIREAKINQKLSWTGLVPLLGKIWFLCLSLTSVYFLEYACLTSFIERAHPKKVDNLNPDLPFAQRNAFVILNFCYQIGVLISRSSLHYVKIKKVGVLTLLQLVNFFIWFFIAWQKVKYGTDYNVYPQFALMVWVGVMGGASYVNVMYLLLSHPKLRKEQKELSLNVTAFFNDIGILSASIWALVMSNSLLEIE
eukprot:TRINITY_DN2047_c0_g1_i19.p1 TRINITY_DN2047_c0_g1~~TRINITY_DN2047_c0_g1_i19.p1  ORF type:complete len:561 (-),score=83.75 TRINITY_DN2047_c0_g1_i19:239-1876(-)